MAATVAYGAVLPPQLYSPPPAPPEPWCSKTLDPEEVRNRLQKTRWELSNRRKILIRNLPQDSSSQEVHELLQDYQLKYCYVDRNKGTAFVTLMNGEQAQDAIQRFNEHSLRGMEISIQFQPTDALLCITNLPPSCTLQEFEELVRFYGNIERCFLVYNEVNGQSKGYGFVEYMKKDYAAKARQELIGKQLQDFTLFAQWMDINQLTPDLIHSKCLCVDKLPKEYRDSEELMHIFSNIHTPIFCQLAKDEGSSFGGFAVIEYDTVEQAQEVIDATDGMLISGNTVQISFCAPGSPGRSTLAALIAAQEMAPNNKKGLLPEPNSMQILKSLNNPAMLQMLLLQPQLRALAGKHGLGASSILPQFLNASVNPALLQLSNAHQTASGNHALALQNFSHLQMAQQQLLKLKNVQTVNNKPGLLGEAPTTLLPTALGISSGQAITDMQHHGETLKGMSLDAPVAYQRQMYEPCLPYTKQSFKREYHEPMYDQASQMGGSGAHRYPTSMVIKQEQTHYAYDSAANVTHSQMQRARMGILPYYANQHGGAQLMPGVHQEKQSSSLGLPESNLPGSKAFQSFQSASTRHLLMEHTKQQNHSKISNPCPGGSLLGEPPKDYRLSTNPFLNLSSVLSNTSLPTISPRNHTAEHHARMMGSTIEASVAQMTSSHPALENYYAQQYGDYAQEGTHQWYSQYSTYDGSQEQAYAQDNQSKELPSATAYGDYNTYLQVMPTYYAGSQETFQPQDGLQSTAQNLLSKTTGKSEKRGSSCLLPSPDPYPVAYAAQQAQDGGDNYADSYFKRKRVF